MAVVEPDIFAALADPTRRLLLERLAVGECTVTELSEGLTMSQAAVSQHLRILRSAGLVVPEKRGYYVHYRLNEETLARWKAMAEGLLGSPTKAEEPAGS